MTTALEIAPTTIRLASATITPAPATWEGSICHDCYMAAHYGDEEGIEFSADWDRDTALESLALGTVTILDENPHFVYSGPCWACDTWDGGDRWDILVTR